MKIAHPVCILTAGQGTRMGVLAKVINKSLLPYQGKAIISHIIESFPADTPFVIALGYLAQQVREYIHIAHPSLNVQFVEVDRYEGTGTGPGYSLLSCQNYLQQAFYFVSCDTLFKKPFHKDSLVNWVGVAKIDPEEQSSYCNMLVSNGQVSQIFDKDRVVADNIFAFSGLMFIHKYELFWTALADKSLISGEHQISNGLLALIAQSSLESHCIEWLDLGTYEKYRAAVEASDEYDFSKTNEFIYFTKSQVIKFFSDETIVAKRVEKASLKNQVFPLITNVGKQWYSYDFVPGNTLYAHNHPRLFHKLLSWLETKVWTPVPNIQLNAMQSLCKSFYQDKTYARLTEYAKKYANEQSCDFVNGQPVASIEQILDNMPWNELFKGIPTFIHGDLQFDNILYDKKTDQFILLDWRQDFAGETSFGDLYYDLAKLMGGIIINYDYIKAGLFSVDKDGPEMYIDFAQRFNRTYYLATLKQFLNKQQLDLKRVQLLVGLIYLNMSPLHHPPFDQALHGLGRLILTEILFSNSSKYYTNERVELFI